MLLFTLKVTQRLYFRIQNLIDQIDKSVDWKKTAYHYNSKPNCSIPLQCVLNLSQ